MTLEYATVLSFKLWFWLFKNPGKKKEDSPYWNAIRGMYAHCSMCEIHNSNCGKCILYHSRACSYAFVKWVKTGKRQYSAHIAWMLRKEIKTKGWEI